MPKHVVGRLKPEGPDLRDVLEAIGEINANITLLWLELQKIAQILRELPADLDRG